MDKSHKYYWPIPEKKMRNFVRQIGQNLNQGESVSILFLPEFGGARAWPKFFLQNINLFPNIFPKPDKYKFLYIDPAELPETSPLGYLQSIHFQLTNEIPSDDTSYPKLLIKIKEIIKSDLKKKELVIFFERFNKQSFINEKLSQNLKSIWQIDKQKIHFVFTLIKPADYKILSDNFGQLAKVMVQNTVKVKPLGIKASKFSIKRWEYMLEADFSDKEFKAILTVAEGYPYLIKACCSALAKKSKDKKRDSEKQLIKYLKKQSLVKYITNQLKQEKELLKLNEKNGKITLGNKNLQIYLSPNEYEVLRLFLEKEGKLVTRDDIAQAMWGKSAFEKYSDWAIDQLISRIRNKLERFNLHKVIKTVHSKGYCLQQN